MESIHIVKNAGEAEETIGEMVAGDFRKAQVFKKWNIDFCCGGKKTLEEICSKKGIAIQELKNELTAIDQQNSSLSYNTWEPDFLADYIINTHHAYVKENLPFIQGLADKVARVHGDKHPETIKIAAVFAEIAQDFGMHLMKEENILFPYIKQLAQAQRENRKISAPAFGTVNNPTRMMEMEHEQAGEDMAQIRELTDNYVLPPGACATYNVLYKKLEEFENDLFNHVHLENNLLFPKAIAMEKQVLENI